MTYRIHTVCDLTGIPRNTLIAWERRYDVTKPARGANGYRDYSEGDVARLLRIKRAISTGLSISEAVRWVNREEADQAPAGEARSPTMVLPLVIELRDRLLQALLAYQRPRAEGVLGQLAALPHDARLTEVLFPVLAQLGDLWERGEATVAQEHFSTAVLRDYISGLLQQVGQRGQESPLAVTCTFPGEEHELPSLGLAVRAGLAGYRVSHLGVNLPAEDLGEFCRRQEPQLVLVSALRAVARGDLVRYGQRVRALAPASARFVVGGRGVDLTPRAAVDGVEFLVQWDELQLSAERRSG